MKGEQKQQILYPLVLVASVLSILIPIGITALFIVLYINKVNITPLILLADVPFLAVGKPLFDLRIKCRNNTEYDEFGRSKRYQSYERMSRQEKNKIDKQKIMDMERVLSSSALKKKTHKGEENPEKAMENLIGLGSTKQYMREMAARMEFECANKIKQADSAKHMVFMGAPGTGKTTVVRIMAGFLYKHKYIKINKCVEVDGNDLRSDNPGDTTVKTGLIIQAAMDGVLFIDEAYAMMNSSGGQEAIATLIKEMEDKRGRFILILAGYTDEMKQLIKANPGFQSRIKEYIDFPDYTTQELDQIFELMARQNNFCVSADAMDNFEKRIVEERKLKSFGNARTVRNILDKAINKHTLNLKDGVIAMEDKFMLRAADVETKVDKNRFDL